MTDKLLPISSVCYSLFLILLL